MCAVRIDILCIDMCLDVCADMFVCARERWFACTPIQRSLPHAYTQAYARDCTHAYCTAYVSARLVFTCAMDMCADVRLDMCLHTRV